MSLKVIILAAGKGTRMQSKLPKVLQPLAQIPLLQHVINTSVQLNADDIITVVGHGAGLVQNTLQNGECHFALQTEQLGTGHAVQQAISQVNDEDDVIILYGDVPLTRVETLLDLHSMISDSHPLSLLTISMADPSGYGRIVRNQHHQVTAIVEQKDSNATQLLINEVNTGMMAVKALWLRKWLSELSNDNAQGEYYLTDIIAACVADGFEIHTTQPAHPIEVAGVNNKSQLQALEREFQTLQAEQLMEQGVTLIDASRIDIRGAVSVGQDVTLDVNVILEGKVSIADDVTIGANCILRNVSVAEGVTIHPFSHLEDCTIGAHCQVGPYARIRPGTELAEYVKIGNFVETKNAKIGTDSKVSHLSYIGDTEMGARCNIGAGTITCNYDGVNKFKTTIGNDVFVGSDTQLVAPVTVADGATIGAGSTITKDAPAETLTLSRSKQTSVPGWQKPTKLNKPS